MRRISRRNSRAWVSTLIVLIISFADEGLANKEGYYGKYIGKLSQLHHGVSGDVFAVDARTLHLRNFNYDGEGPAAYFYAGNTKAPGANGFRLRDERGTTNVLPKYRNKHITITLPEGKTLQNIKWFSVWCDEFSVNFGDVKIPKNLDYPKPQKIGRLSGVHGVSSESIVIVDAQTLLVPSFSYDGEAPDAKFWVGAGLQPSPRGIRIPDENGKEVPLRRYDRKTIVLTLPGDLTVFDIGHFGVWCEAFTVDFGHVQIPRGLNVPPSLKMLGVSPQSKLNCEVLWDDFAYEVRWAVAGDSIVLQLVARLENNEYMSFGLSGDLSKSRMVGGDVVVAWVDKDSLKGYAEDYYLDAKSQCSGGRGSCPDESIEKGTGSVRLLNAALVNGYSIVTFQRSLRAQDELDKTFFTNGSQPVIWAIGPLNSRKEVSYHSLTNKENIFINFGRPPKWNCPTPESVAEQPSADIQSKYNSESIGTSVQDPGKQESAYTQESILQESQQKTSVPTPAPAPKAGAWEIPPIMCHEPEDGVFYAQMGPTGGKHGYSAITGHVGWGISWYINGLLIPEINVVRGRTYTFIVEGGLDPETPARYHPFYITDDPVGGYQYKTPEERLNIQIFAGAVQNKRGEVRPTGIGRLCNWTPDPQQPPADEFASFGAYQRTLRLECDPGNPGIIQWTVHKDTPDTVYYQCYTHRYLGWKINVHDHCESEAGSEPIPSILKPPEDFQIRLKESESINYEVKIRPKQDDSFQRNRTLQDMNEFESKVRSKISSETSLEPKDWNNEFGLKPSYGKIKEPQQQAIAIYSRPLQSHSDSEVRIPQPQQQYIRPSPSLVRTKQNPGISSYNFAEASFDNLNDQKTFKNFQILPSKTEAYPHHDLRHQPLKKDIHKGKPFHILSFMEPMRNGEKGNQILRIPEDGKLKKHSPKIESRNKVRVRSPVPSSSMTQGRRHLKPHSAELFQLPGLSKSTKRPTFPTLTYADSIATQTFEFPFPFEIENKPVKLPIEKNLASVTYRRNQNNHFAQNTGFDPNSVKVESGFKPILYADKASSDFNNVDRADLKFEGVEDKLVERMSNREKLSYETKSVDKEKDQERAVDKTIYDITEEIVRTKINPFKNQMPELFKPVFVPSFPDEHVRKYQGKSKKYLVTSFENGEPLNRQKNEQTIQIKIKPDFNMIQRSIHPESFVKVSSQKPILESKTEHDQNATDEYNINAKDESFHGDFESFPNDMKINDKTIEKLFNETDEVINGDDLTGVKALREGRSAKNENTKDGLATVYTSKMIANHSVREKRSSDHDAHQTEDQFHYHHHHQHDHHHLDESDHDINYLNGGETAISYCNRILLIGGLIFLSIMKRLKI